VVRALGHRCLTTWGVAVAIWLSDRVMCSLWLAVGFPYLHSLWHVLVFHSSYQACVLFAFFDTRAQYPELAPRVSFWPGAGNTWCGLPVLHLRNAVPLPTHRRPCALC
jgi:alkaline ceramidase